MASIRREIWNTFGIDRAKSCPYTASQGSRRTLAKLFAKLGYERGAEIGTCRGDYAARLCAANPRLQLMCVDPWEPYCESPTATHQESCYEAAVKQLSKYPGATIIRKTSVEASKQVQDDSLDFVYIDGAHDFDSVMLDLIHWSPKVKRGGRAIMAGHDYVYIHWCRVPMAVNAYAQAHGVADWYVTAETCRSWFWVKP